MKRKQKVLILIVISLIIFLCISIPTFSKFIVTKNSNMNSKLAEPIFVLSAETKQSSEYTDNVLTEFDESKANKIEIKNYNSSGKVNEIKGTYNLEFIVDDSIKDKIIILLFDKDKNKVKLENLKTNNFSLQATNKQEDIYYAEVFIIDNTSDITSEIQIKANFIQDKLS